MATAVVIVVINVLYHKFNKRDNFEEQFIFSKVGYENVGTYSESLIPMMMYNQWGYCDNQGKVLIVPQFYEVGTFSQGVAPVRKTENGFYGYIDRTGNYVKELQYHYAGEFSEELAACASESPTKLGYMNQSGNFVIPEQYYEAGKFSEGLAKVKQSQESFYFFIDNSGKVMIPAEYENATDFSEGLAAVSNDGKWGYIDKTGTMVIPPQYEKAQEFHEGFAAVLLNGSWGYIDKTGNVTIQAIYQQAGDFSEGFAPIQLSKSGLWGYIDNSGELVIDASYQEATSFSNGVGAIKENDQWFFIMNRSVIEKTNNNTVEETSTSVAEETNSSVPEEENQNVDDETLNTNTPEETVHEENIVLEHISDLSLHVNGTIPLTGILKVDKMIEKLILRVLGEDGEDQGIYLSLKPNSNNYSLSEIILDGRIAPFNAVGKYSLQFVAILEGDLEETLLGQTAVEVLPAQITDQITLSMGLMNSREYPQLTISYSVLDEGYPLNSLEKEQFSLYETIAGQNETEQIIDYIMKPSDDNGLAVSLVFDSSLSMYNDDRSEANSLMEFAKNSAIEFIRSEGLGPNDQISIQSFGKAFATNQDFTNNDQALIRAIKGIRSIPDTAIYDAIIKSIDTLSDLESKKCIIIFTDGEDTASKRTYSDSIESAVASGIPVYSIAIGEEAKTNELKSISDQSGGYFYYLKDTKQLSQIYKEITEQLRNQYQLSYQSSSLGESGGKVELRLVVTSGASSAETKKSYRIP